MKCVFCMKDSSQGVVRIKDGGRISMCNTCCTRLVDEGFLGGDQREVVLHKPLMQVLSSGSPPSRFA